MRVLASYLAGILTLIMLLAAGGAWSASPEPDLVSADVPREAIVGRFPLDLELTRPVSTVELPPGCVPPLEGATCAIVAVAGGLDLPMDYHDLIPDDLRSVEDWRPLVSAFFEPHHVDRALRVIRCESHGNPTAKNPRSSARGLFQHLGRLWPERAVKAGWSGSDIYDPVANVAVAAWLVYEGGGWSHWNPSRSCWG